MGLGRRSGLAGAETQPKPAERPLEHDPRALSEDLALGGREHHRTDASQSLVGSRPGGGWRPGNYDSVISRAQTGNHKIKTVRRKCGPIQVKKAGGVNRTSTDYVEQVGADL